MHYFNQCIAEKFWRCNQLSGWGASKGQNALGNGMQIIKVEQIEQIEQSESKIPWIKAECLAKKARTVW